MLFPVYMDHHATTPCDPSVVEAMLPYFTERFGNSASRSHLWGWQAEDAVEQARKEVAALIGAAPREIVFTSGATEADNLAIKGALGAYGHKARHLVVSPLEHAAVRDTVRHLEQSGAAEVTWLPVGASGVIDPADVRAALREDTLLVAVMHANNEIGTVSPIGEIGALCREAGVLFFTDAVQSVGRLPFDVQDLNLDLASLSGHKIYGPKGVGALYVRRRSPRVRLTPLIHGGGHEGGLRSGTLPVPLVVGLGKACALAEERRAADAETLAALRDRLLGILFEGLGEGVHVNGDLTRRLPNNLNVAFAGVDGDGLLLALRGEVALSSGSACASGAPGPSPVLDAIGLDRRLAHASIRFGLGRGNTEEEVERVGWLVVERVRELRGAG